MNLSETIERDLRLHIQAGRLPCPLTLHGIAEYYNVSLMPARIAVAALVDERFLIRQPAGRLKANPRRRKRCPAPAAQSRPIPIPPDQALADYVIELSLRGEEIFFREEAASERFGVGRTVVRRILNRLAGERLIEHIPRRGWRVQPYRENDMLEYLDVREVLELHALDLARPRLETAHLRKLLEANTPNELGAPRLDNSLHEYWINLAGNRYIRQLVVEQGVYFQALFDRAALAGPTVAQRASEHREILTALIGQDWRRARRALSKHIRGQRPNVAHMLERLRETPDESSDFEAENRNPLLLG